MRRTTGSASRGDIINEDPLYERDEEDEEEVVEEEGGKASEETLEAASASEDASTSKLPHLSGAWTLEQYMQKEQRPGLQPLVGRRRNISSHHLDTSSSNSPLSGTESNSHSFRTPAAGAGTRVGPRPVPKSSSSLRHISSNARTSSFGVALPEDRDPHAEVVGDYRIVLSSVEAAKRRQVEALENFLGDDSDEDDGLPQATTTETTAGWEADLYGSLGKRQASWAASSQGNNGSKMDLSGYDESGGEEEMIEEEGGHQMQHQIPASQAGIEEEPSWSNLKSTYRYSDADIGGPSNEGPRRAAWHPKGPLQLDSPPILGFTSGMTTPGPVFHQTLHTPQRSPDFDPMPTIEPRQRLEWHTMLQSVLRSEVLQSETKRITSADAPTSTKRELMYQRWLDIRASLRGRGHYVGAVEAEERRLREGWPRLLGHVIESVQQCRSGKEPIREDKLKIDDASLAIDDTSGLKERALEEVGYVLQQIDDAECHFPSQRKLTEEVPSWTDETLQKKLDALYSWYNVTTGLRMEMKILQQWTGSKTLDIIGHQDNQSNQVPAESPGSGAIMVHPEMEESTFLERILKEDSLQSTFEKRTLRSINTLTIKAKGAMIEHREAFGMMKLPSFEPELSQLINFPTRLMEGALKLRLDYAGKLKEPSVLIVDSLTDDLRAAIALACRIKLQYNDIMVPEPSKGWDLPPCIGQGYDTVLQQALQFFFKLLNYKLKGSVFFKETEILEPEWKFLSTAVEAIEAGDLIVATSITGFVNKLFRRIVKYFERELSAPSIRRNAAVESLVNSMAQMNQSKDGIIRGPSTIGALTKGTIKMTLEEKVRWIHGVFNSVRIRSRKLLSFARDIRNRLENAAEYDLSTLTSNEVLNGQEMEEESQREELETNTDNSSMSLTAFLQTLIDAGYFLVFTEHLIAEGIYVLAEPSLSDKPELIQEIFSKCLRQVRPGEQHETATTTLKEVAVGGDVELREDESDNGIPDTSLGNGGETPKYLLLLSPRDAFLWTGRIMSLDLPQIDVDLKERRLRLIAEGANHSLQVCQKHLYSIFRAAAPPSTQEPEEEVVVEQTGPVKFRSKAQAAAAAAAASSAAAAAAAMPKEISDQDFFPLEVIAERLAHISAVQMELSRINQGVYMLSDAIIRAVPQIRRNLRGQKYRQTQPSVISPTNEDRRRGIGASGDTDELIQNCFSMASEQGFRALPFIESARLQGQMTLALATLAIDWVAFICDDCEPSDRKTFKWAVAALENAQHVTRQGGILNISEADFIMMRAKVASCVGLLISHFDILGARSSVAKAKEEELRLEKEKADRIKALDGEYSQAAAKAVEEGGIVGAPPLLRRADSGLRATEERWVSKVMEWDDARQAIEAEQRLIGRVLDDTRPEDRGLQFLASSSSRIQIRWQQGRFIGQGTFGTVYLAVNLDSGGLMAVKEIRFQDISSTPGMYKQIKDEMSVMEMLSHPNIVEYYGIEVHRDKVYIFEEYCQGGSLAQLLEHGRIEDETVVQVYTLQMLDGLVYLHSKGVVHRDIKPDNILLDHMGVIKFVDFGAAKVLAKNSKTIIRSRKPGIVNAAGGGGGMPGAPASLQGTPMYMSPEVIKGESRGRRGAMDVWSLGCVVLEFATGRRPWGQMDNEWAIMFHIGMAQQHPPLPEPGQLSDLGIEFIRTCLIIDPYDRPSAIELREHQWIRSLIDDLNRANEGENILQGQGAEGGANQSYIHGMDTAAGVAAMAAATPGVQSINGFNFRSSTASSFGADSSLSSSSNVNTPVTIPASYPETPLNKPSVKFSSDSKTVPLRHDPGHPNHSHSGYEALIADLAYKQEDQQTKAMQESED